MQNQAFMEEIVRILSQPGDFRPRVSPREISLETRFREDLGFDSLALMSLAYELQEKYPDLDETAIAGWVTVRDCAQSVV